MMTLRYDLEANITLVLSPHVADINVVAISHLTASVEVKLC